MNQYAARSSRLIGQFLDGIFGVAPFLLSLLLGGLTFSPVLGEILSLASLAWAAFYYLFADGFSNGQSFAKRRLGLHVIDEKTGRPCSFMQSFVRNLLLSILGPIDWIFIFGEKHQRLGDKAAGTIVVAD